MMGMKVWARRALFMGLAAAAGLVAPVMAQTPTPEGTVLSNTATVSYSDANGNTYADVSATVTVTVGFQAGVRVTGGEADTPAPGSTGHTMAFTIENIGNGGDQFQVSETNTNAGVMNVTGYTYGGTTYATIADLNTALLPVTVATGAGITITVNYTVPAGTGGQTATYTLGATSNRDAGAGDESHSGSGTVSPTLSLGVSVTPDGLGANVERLPSNGTVYTQTFAVANDGSGTATFNLSATGGAVVTVTAMEIGGVAATDVTLNASESEDVLVSYTVAEGGAGATEALTLTATADLDATATDNGSITVERVRAALAIAKRALDGARSGDVTTILPGEFIEYQVSVTNNGSSDAENVVVTDELDGDYLTFQSVDGDGAVWTSITDAVNGDGNTEVTATLADPLAPGATATFYIRVQVK